MEKDPATPCKPSKQYGIFPEGARRRPIAIVPGENAKNSLHICWMLHDLCNHRCSYCDPINWGGEFRDLELGDAVFFLLKVFRHYPDRRYHVSFTGGEPTLWPDFLRLCEFLRKQGCDVGLTSNGSRPVAFWEKLADQLNWACLSYHPEFTRDDEFFRVVQTLAPRTRLAVRLMMHPAPEQWDRSVAFGERLRKLPADFPVFVEYVPLQKNFGRETESWPYEEWHREFFRRQNHFTVGDPGDEVRERLARKRDVWDYFVLYDDGSREFCRPNEMVARDQVNFQGWRCEAGRELLFVNQCGLVHRGGCRVGGLLGKITDLPKLALPTEDITCDRDFCPCGTDILTSKRAPVPS